MKKLIAVIVFLMLVGSAEAGMHCYRGGIYEGATKAEVIQKCGQPIYVEKEGWELSADEVWTYVERGYFRLLHFQGRRLEWIETGDRAR